jgi:hypothetical protein
MKNSKTDITDIIMEQINRDGVKRSGEVIRKEIFW